MKICGSNLLGKSTKRPRVLEEIWNKVVMNKITALIEDILLHPYSGIGKPEALKHNLAGAWSRRIDREHRIIYQVTNENTIEILNILSLKGHYE